MKKISILFLFIGVVAFAQKKLTVEEATYGQYQMYAPSSLIAPQWQKNSNTISYLDAGYSKLIVKSAENNWKEIIVLTKDELGTVLKNKFPSDDFNLRMFPYDYSWHDAGVLSMEVQGKNAAYSVLYDVQKKQIINAFSIAAEAANKNLSPNGKHLAWLNENNINITTGNNRLLTVTNDADKGIVNGSENTHRQEFGIKTGMWWSPDSNKLLYYRKDETMVSDYPLVDFTGRIAENKNIKYPMAGMKSEEVTLVVYDIVSGSHITYPRPTEKTPAVTRNPCMFSIEPHGCSLTKPM